MPKYAFEAIRQDGTTTTGSVKERTRSTARTELETRGLSVISMTEKKSVANFEISKSRIKPVELMYLSRQIAAFTRAGIPILDAISELSEDSDRRAVKRVLAEVSQDLRSGLTLTESFNKHPKDFPDFYRGILSSAELTGRLDLVLAQLSEYLERDLSARRKVRSAMIYPAFVAIMALGTIGILTVVVLPKFAEFFASLDVPLPASTQFMLDVSSFLSSWAWLIGIILVLMVIGYFVAMKFRGPRKIRDRIMLRIPVIGTTVRFAMIERFTRILASMVQAGVSIPEAMRVAAESVTNLVYQDALMGVRQRMLEGEGLAGPIAQTGLFPGMATQMFRVGETTGTLDNQLEVAADYYSAELGYKVDKLASLLEPTVVVIMGTVVGFVAFALVSAMYGIFQSHVVELAMRNREGSGDEGETLVELLVSIALLGIASIAIMASITMGLKASALSAGLAQNQNLLRNWAEVLNATPYIDCATASSYGVPIGMDVPANVDLVVTEVAYWDEGTSGFIGSCSTDEGAQRLTLQTTVESGTNQPSVNELKIVIRKPCVSGC